MIRRFWDWGMLDYPSVLFRQVCRIVAFRDSLERNVTPPNPSSKSKFHMRRFPFHRQRGHLYFLIMMGRLNITASFRKEQHRPLPINGSSLLTFFPAGGVLNSQNIPTQRKKERERIWDLYSPSFLPGYIFFFSSFRETQWSHGKFQSIFSHSPNAQLNATKETDACVSCFVWYFFQREREKKSLEMWIIVKDRSVS